MISLLVIFWTIVIIFALTSFFRPWPKEVLALVAQLVALLLILEFVPVGYRASRLLISETFTLTRGQTFFAATFFHLLFTFFAYQGGGLMGFTRRRITREEIKLQERVFSSVLGTLNGYLLAGSLLSYLEYVINDATWQWERLNTGVTSYDLGNQITRVLTHLDRGVYRNLPFRFAVEYTFNIPLVTPSRILLLLLGAAILFFLIAD